MWRFSSSYKVPLHSQHLLMSQLQTPLSTVRIFVTRDGEHYHVVDISRATNGNWIRCRILSKFQIPEELIHQYSIYPSEVGSLALGGALSDHALFGLCQESGTPFGDLKFYIPEPRGQPLAYNYANSYMWQS